MIQLLLNNPLLLLFLVAAIGYLIGKIKIHGGSLGVAAVLFVGLAFGSLHPDLKLPEVVYLLGLVLFVYTVGISSGPGFFASFRRKGLRDNLLVIGMLTLAMIVAIIAHKLLHLQPAQTAGMFAGSLTNTPALASVLDYVKAYAPKASLDHMLAEPVVAYSLTYPIGVVGMILAIYLMQRIWKTNYAKEAASMRELGATHVKIHNRTIRVTRPESTHTSIHELVERHKWHVVFGRMKRNGQLSLAIGETHFQVNDLVSVVGTREDLDRVTAALGEVSDERLELDRSQFDFRRIFVSNTKIAGQRLRDLNLPQQFGAIVTRVRRGDIEFLPHGDTVLELGDRIRVLTRRDHMDTVSAFLGDSYRAVSEIDVLTFGLGLALGLLAGLVPIPLPGGVVVKLGLAGGPLLVAMILGTLGRTGPLVWSLPYSANLTLRQVGLILFLAGVGTRAGYAFATTFTEGSGFLIFVAGAIITCVAALTTLWVGHRLLKIPMSLLIGMLAGMQTQPAVLGFALEQTKNELPNIGYATVYPIATISKILFAQFLLTLLL
ncbi:MAG: transporter [candidate division KSB1 bacterium]|nr:transporter [candidate division KSB1 bacterium]MDZ7302663.1 transporter [candidate division KSB1 bacterium]MDZ7311807.1 transporter [candidate division KSB1 bacterium]